jgi:hypothetical protein
MRRQQQTPSRPFKVGCRKENSPVAWIGTILDEVGEQSAPAVGRNLVGAKLAVRFPEAGFHGSVPDIETTQAGDFVLGTTAFHVTTTPNSTMIEKCGTNLSVGLHPVLLVPRAAVPKAIHVAEDLGLEKCITIVAIEDFIALNIVEMSEGNDAEFVKTLKEIVTVYNRRLGEVETDMSLKIEIE